MNKDGKNIISSRLYCADYRNIVIQMKTGTKFRVIVLVCKPAVRSNSEMWILRRK
jgi:hypothetical protein